MVYIYYNKSICSIRRAVTLIGVIRCMLTVMNIKQPCGVVSYTPIEITNKRQHMYKVHTHSNYRRESDGFCRRSRCIILPSSNAGSTSGPSLSLKLVSEPLLDAGKAFARTGELLIDLTNSIDIYGGALSSTGANIRNAGDNIAQAAASCRFKTGMELVIDEIREASSALMEGSDKLQQAILEANIDKNAKLASSIEAMLPHLKGCSVGLEAAGASLLQRQSLTMFGQHLISVGKDMSSLSSLLQTLSDENENSNSSRLADEASQRCQYAATQMMLAGTNLIPKGVESDRQSTGKSWLKGGR